MQVAKCYPEAPETETHPRTPSYRTRSMSTLGTWQPAVAPAGMCPASLPSPMAPHLFSWYEMTLRQGR